MSRIRMDKGSRKEQIRKAAKKVFLEKGFENTVMDDIMQATGLSRGGLYHHYGNTNEILYDIMDEGNIAREQIIKKTVELKDEISFNELISEIVVEKMLVDNTWISIYVMFLQEMKNDKNLKRLYEKLKENSIQGILQSLPSKENKDEFLLSVNFIINLINTIILGCEILGIRKFFNDNREVLKKMIEVVLNNTKIENLKEDKNEE